MKILSPVGLARHHPLCPYAPEAELADYEICVDCIYGEMEEFKNAQADRRQQVLNLEARSKEAP